MAFEFEWDEGNVEELAWHDVEPYEVVEVFENPYWEQAGPYIEEGEERWNVIGETHGDPGRILKVVITFRGEKVRPITAFTPNQTELRGYKRRFRK